MVSLHPNHNNTRDGSRPSTRPRPSSPRRSPDMYRFGASDSYRPGSYNDRDSDRPRRESDRRGEFTFRPEYQGPRFPPADSRRPPPKNRRDQKKSRQQPRGGRAGPWKPPAPSERPILRSNREPTPEQLAGMNDGAKRFISLDDISDSEAEMDLESEVGDEQATGEEQPPTKKARSEAPNKDDGNAASRWSNPDPYTTLPPPDESQAKKRDVVKMIRKAKVAAEQEASAKNAVTQNADFISLNFDDDENNDESNSSSEALDEDIAPAGLGTTHGASFSHLGHLHPDRLKSVPNSGSTDSRVLLNPTMPLNAASLGPPPTLPQLPPLPPLATGLDVWPPPPPPPSRPSNELGSFAPSLVQGKKRKRGGAIDGSIVESWLPRDHASSTPWCTIDHSRTTNMGFWLHKEIADFYEFVKPHRFEDRIRNDLVKRISTCLTKRFPDGELHCFGSFAAGLYLPTADMDLVFNSEQYRRGGRTRFSNKSMLYKVAKCLEGGGIIQADTTEIVANARVPIIKLVDRLTGLKVDISFENNSGIIANSTFQQWKAQYPAMPIIATLVKHFLAMRGLNEVFTGGLGGFSVICMVVSLIQHLPASQSGNLAPDRHLGDILLEFFDLYGNKFNINHARIRLNPPGYEAKGAWTLNGKPERPDRLSIIDPNTPDNDISVGSHNILLIQRCFSDAFKTLHTRMGQLQKNNTSRNQLASILGSILAGDYTSFELQRRRLKQIYDSSHREPPVPRPVVVIRAILDKVHELDDDEYREVRLMPVVVYARNVISYYDFHGNWILSEENMTGRCPEPTCRMPIEPGHVHALGGANLSNLTIHLHFPHDLMAEPSDTTQHTL